MQSLHPISRKRISFCRFGLVLVWAVCLQQVAAQQSAPIPSLGRDLKMLASPTARLREHVDAGADGWASEEVAQQLQSQLGGLADRILEQSAGSWSNPLVHDSFSGSQFHRYQPHPVRTGPKLRVDRFTPTHDGSLTAVTLEDGLRHWLREVREPTVVQFKLLSVEVSSDGLQVQSRVRFHVVGGGDQGLTIEFQGDWDLSWQKTGELWLMTRLEAPPYTRAEAAGGLFRDVTVTALAGQDEAVEQLKQGVDWYSSTLDGAVGIDIYGHNGVAVGDVDGDGWEDFYVCQPAGLPNRLFRNRGDGSFEDISARSGTDLLDLSSSALFLDYDNDGDSDLLVVGQSLMLLRNLGEGRFETLSASDSGLEPLLEEKTILTAVAAADYDRDGDLDVFVASYAWRTGLPGYRYPTPYHDATNGSPNLLFRNDDGRFQDVTQQSGIGHNNNRFSLAAAWGDYDSDGDADLYVANDFGRNNLYRNDGQGGFEDVAAEAGVEDLGAGMSVSWGDFDNDGRVDLYVGNMFSSAGLRVASQPGFIEGAAKELRSSFLRHAKGNTLFRNRGDGTFDDVTDEAGVALGRWSWSSQFLDIDADGYQDLLIANGYITNEDTRDL